jgi:hypothetical protein
MHACIYYLFIYLFIWPYGYPNPTGAQCDLSLNQRVSVLSKTYREGRKEVAINFRISGLPVDILTPHFDRNVRLQNNVMVLLWVSWGSIQISAEPVIVSTDNGFRNASDCHQTNADVTTGNRPVLSLNHYMRIICGGISN